MFLTLVGFCWLLDTLTEPIVTVLPVAIYNIPAVFVT
jgi:hypothetical protein